MTYIFKRAIEFFEWAPAAGLLLIATTVLAVLANNSFLAPAYGAFLSTPVAVSIGALSIDKPLVLWINDGLMAVFFFLIGLVAYPILWFVADREPHFFEVLRVSFGSVRPTKNRALHGGDSFGA